MEVSGNLKSLGSLDYKVNNAYYFDLGFENKQIYRQQCGRGRCN